jgi:hypothetical protein
LLAARAISARSISVPPASKLGRIERAAEPGIAFDYLEPVAAALRALKFDGDRRPARVLGTLLALRLATCAARDRSSHARCDRARRLHCTPNGDASVGSIKRCCSPYIPARRLGVPVCQWLRTHAHDPTANGARRRGAA